MDAPAKKEDGGKSTFVTGESRWQNDSCSWLEEMIAATPDIPSVCEIMSLNFLLIFLFFRKLVI